MSAVPEALDRTAEAMKMLKKSASDQEEIVVCPTEMGENVAVHSGFSLIIIRNIRHRKTTAVDNHRAGHNMLALGRSVNVYWLERYSTKYL